MYNDFTLLFRIACKGILGEGPSMDTDWKLARWCSFYDQEIGDRLLNKTLRRPRASFDFVQHGRFEKQAEAMRLKVSTSACHA